MRVPFRERSLRIAWKQALFSQNEPSCSGQSLFHQGSRFSSVTVLLWPSSDDNYIILSNYVLAAATVLKEQISKRALFQMPRSLCISCSSLLHETNGHSECVTCLGSSHAEAALSAGGCSRCESMPFSMLRSRLALFNEYSEAALPALPFPALLEPQKKKCRNQWQPERMDLSEPMPATSPRASLSPSQSPSPVLFTQADQRPSQRAAGLVSFGRSDEEVQNDDSLSVAASEVEWSDTQDCRIVASELLLAAGGKREGMVSPRPDHPRK